MKLHKIASALAFTAMAASSQAAIINNWAYHADGGFINSALGAPFASSCQDAAGNPVSNAACQLNYGANDVLVPVGGSANVGGILDGAQTHLSVSWGVPSTAGGNPDGLQSSLDVLHNAGVIQTNQGWYLVDTFTHHNNVIKYGPTPGNPASWGFMDSTPVYGGFHITSPVPITAEGVSPLFFLETNNLPPATNSSPTGVQNALDCLQTPNPIGSQCDDLYTTAPLNGISFFNIGGVDYSLEFRFRATQNSLILDLNPLDPFVNIFCGENVDCQIVTEVRINAIPEPAPLALIGLGLAGLAVIRRRKAA